ncbi:MAG: hypothetical protein PHC95_15765 [Parabacteroides sp.]|nr:hypothetical protein [Parabacteroides sp.]
MTRKRKRRKRKPAFAKILMIAILLICLEIVIYAEVVMVYLSDLSALYALIGIVGGLALAIWAYCEKSGKENTKGGITYDLAMMSKTPPPAGEDKDDGSNNEEV